MPARFFPLGSRHGLVPGRWLTAGSLEVTANRGHYLGSEDPLSHSRILTAATTLAYPDVPARNALTPSGRLAPRWRGSRGRRVGPHRWASACWPSRRGPRGRGRAWDKATNQPARPSRGAGGRSRGAHGRVHLPERGLQVLECRILDREGRVQTTEVPGPDGGHLGLETGGPGIHCCSAVTGRAPQ